MWSAHTPTHNTHTHTHNTQTQTHMHLVAHCGLGIGLAAGKCCTGRIGKQGDDAVHERTGDGVLFKSVARSASTVPNDVRLFSSGKEIAEEAP